MRVQTIHAVENRCNASRSGFTLLELMIVVVIIAILIGLLVPAVGSVRIRARIAQVRSDIGRLDDAIAQFKITYGIEPPSRIVLHASAANWETATTTPPLSAADNRRFKGIIKQIWPQFDFDVCGGYSNGMTFPTLPGTPAFIDLNGAECLVFFLNGVTDGTSGGFVGFAKDPEHPFSPASGADAITSREGPFLKSDIGGLNVASGKYTGRLVDLDSDMMPELLDLWPGQTNPYVYFSASSGSYRVEAGAPPTPSGCNATPPTMTWRNSDCLPLMGHAYYASPLNSMSPGGARPHAAGGHQIISPGADGQYGVGRYFNPADATNSISLPFMNLDRDNITNFHNGGRLSEGG